MRHYLVKMRYVAEDWAIVDAENREQAIERAYDATTAPMGEDWIVNVGSDILRHFNPICVPIPKAQPPTLK